MSRTDPANFNALLASSIHDLKNSLGMVIQTVEESIVERPPVSDEERKRYAVLQSESAKINNNLIALLSLYRLENRQLQLNVEEVYLEDFLEEQFAYCKNLFALKNLQCHVECEKELVAYFDPTLISGVINNALLNAVRYADSTVELTATKADGGVKIEVKDDGPGYPASIIEHTDAGSGRIDFSGGSTKLGLYFASTIAVMHTNANRRGQLNLINLPSGGSAFQIWLP